MEVKQFLSTAMESRLKTIADTNPYPKAECNGVWLEGDLQTIKDHGFEEAEECDVVIHYDYMTDELDGGYCDKENYGGSECEKWLEWYSNKLFSEIYELMSELGYEEVDEMDGSGGGMYYGQILFRK